MNFDEAKQKVAETHGYPTWRHLRTSHRHMPYQLELIIDEATEIYARNLANEKVREDRKDIVLVGDHHNLDIASLVNNRPLPFPDEK